IGVTPSHPFFSADRNDWVAAGRLEVGERVLTNDGTAVVEWYVMREKPEEVVYNIEVEGDHCYRVGESGILVHNSSAGVTTLPAPPPTFQGCDCEEVIRTLRQRGGRASPVVLASWFQMTPANLRLIACRLYETITMGRRNATNFTTRRRADD